MEFNKEKLVNKRKLHFSPSLKTSYKSPILFIKSKYQYLYDENENEYLDAYNNVAHVGHCHPNVVDAISKQISTLNTNTRYLHPLLVEYAEKLLSKFKKPLEVCFFVNSGSEANDLALRLASRYTKGNDVIVLENAYHGTTQSCVNISPTKHKGTHFYHNDEDCMKTPNFIHKIDVPNVFRGPKESKYYSNQVKEKLKNIENLSCFIAESIQGVGGQIFYPNNFLIESFEHVRNAGGVCICDEVQVGFGRTGKNFWGFESQGVNPDIVVLGKPIGNGYPLGCVVTTREIANTFSKVEYFNTFGGSTTSCAAGLAVLNVIEEENLQQNALEVGNYFLEKLNVLKDQFEIIGDVRGSGLYIGIEFVKDRKTLEPAMIESSFICQKLVENRILTGTDGPLQNVLKIKPPLCFSKENVDYFVKCLKKILKEDFVNKKE
eukprot:gene1951-1459_t